MSRLLRALAILYLPLAGIALLGLALSGALGAQDGSAPAAPALEGGTPEAKPSEGRLQESRYSREGRFLVHELAGVVPEVSPRIRIESDLGSVRVQGAPAREIRYRIRVRAAGADDAAARRSVDALVISVRRSGDQVLITGQAARPEALRQLRAEYEITVPSDSPAIEAVTGSGDVEIAGVAGSANVSTRGGTITARDLGGPLEADTRGGNIEVGSVRSAMRLSTAGGSVRVEKAGGDLVAQTMGGDVVIGRVAGGVRAETGGGSVRLVSATGDVVAGTSGGNIVLGEVGGQVSAATAGGSIRVASAGGGVRCQTAAGPIDLAAVDGPIRAVTSAGSIRADLAAIVKAARGWDSDLQTFQGDIVVSLPEGLPLTIRALVDNAVGQRIKSDFPLKMSRESEGTGGPTEIAEGQIGVGGSVLKIRTLGGNIVILKAKAPKHEN